MTTDRIFLSRPHMGGTELDYIHDAEKIGLRL